MLYTISCMVSSAQPQIDSFPPNLTTRQKTFIVAYCELKNGVQAAIRAGYSAKSAGAEACRQLRKAKVRDEINRRLSQAEWDRPTYNRIGRMLFEQAENWQAKARFFELLGKSYGFLNEAQVNVNVALMSDWRKETIAYTNAHRKNVSADAYVSDGLKDAETAREANDNFPLTLQDKSITSIDPSDAQEKIDDFSYAI